MSAVRQRFLSVIAVLALPAAAAGAASNSLDVRVVGITDGDTITVLDTLNTQRKVRLAGIDAPEAEQPFGNLSKQNLSRLLQGREVHIDWSKTDRFGRLVATIRVARMGACPSKPCSPVVDAALEQLGAGMAWHDKDFADEQSPPDRREYAATEQQARAGHAGLWAGRNPVPPWEWRRGLSSGPVKKSRNDICHEPASASYKATTNFESFPTLEACLASGGRRPGNP
jgi:endonuclease YncB( thermonuclease family)